MPIKLPRLLVALALAFSLGLHWAVLQSVAWLNMAVSYARTAPLKEALVKTFDGQHPCQLCRFVSAGQQKEQKRTAQQPVVKLELGLRSEPVSLVPPAPLEPHVPGVAALSPRPQLPPVPPPRGA